ncbi:MAG: hypothetical protein QOJ26_1566 [Thermoplasmata archaeon]|nr:hypothetical protein [Thermoplasmata archaeon]MEA3166694.1 hypothetical protein [Thermoplasmata archaeon]
MRFIWDTAPRAFLLAALVLFIVAGVTFVAFDDPIAMFVASLGGGCLVLALVMAYDKGKAP